MFAGAVLLSVMLILNFFAVVFQSSPIPASHAKTGAADTVMPLSQSVSIMLNVDL